MTILLEVAGAGFFHRLGIKLADILTSSNKKNPRITLDQPLADPVMSDEEIWNIVTDYGKYREVWPIYRNNGLLEAIKARDEKAEFDRRVSEIGVGSQNQLDASPSQQNLSSKPDLEKVVLTSINSTQKKLDELDLALMRSLASYFEQMPDKIRHYHRDHHASQEEAEVIANYYLKTADIVRGVKTQKDLKELIEFLETLKDKVSRYQHESYKYRWSTGLEKEVLVKLKKILP